MFGGCRLDQRLTEKIKPNRGLGAQTDASDLSIFVPLQTRLEARVEVDLDRVPALVEDRERLWAMVARADFITPEEKREMVGWK